MKANEHKAYMTHRHDVKLEQSVQEIRIIGSLRIVVKHDQLGQEIERRQLEETKSKLIELQKQKEEGK